MTMPSWRTWCCVRDHPQKEQLVSYLQDGVSVFEFLTPEYRGKVTVGAVPTGSVPGGRIPPLHHPRRPLRFLVRNEVRALVKIKRGCLVTWADICAAVTALPGPPETGVIHLGGIGQAADGHQSNAVPLNDCRCRHVPLTMGTAVSRVQSYSGRRRRCSWGAWTANKSGFHNLGLQAESWPLCAVWSALRRSRPNTTRLCTTTPFGWNESPVRYHTPSARRNAAYVRSCGPVRYNTLSARRKRLTCALAALCATTPSARRNAAHVRTCGAPVLAYADDALYANFVATFEASARIQQWLAFTRDLALSICCHMKITQGSIPADKNLGLNLIFQH